jgi:hypothetical protein
MMAPAGFRERRCGVDAIEAEAVVAKEMQVGEGLVGGGDHGVKLRGLQVGGLGVAVDRCGDVVDIADEDRGLIVDYLLLAVDDVVGFGVVVGHEDERTAVAGRIKGGGLRAVP